MQSSSIQKNMALLKYSCCAAYYTRFRPKPKCITVQLRTFLCVLLPYRNRALDGQGIWIFAIPVVAVMLQPQSQ
jgi:hypothetical protein